MRSKVQAMVRRGLACLGVIVALATALQWSTPARADSSVQLPGGGQVLTDEVHHHVFVSDVNNGALYVLGYDGSWETTVPGIPGAYSMVLVNGTIYVGSGQVNQITEVSTSTLQITGVDATGSISAPVGLAAAGGRIWFSDANTCIGSGMASIELDGSGLTVYEPGKNFPACPSLAGSPDGQVLVAAGYANSKNTLYKYDVSRATPKLLLKVANPYGYGPTLRVSPDDQTLLLTYGALPNNSVALDMSDLETVSATYPCEDCDDAAVFSDQSHVAFYSEFRNAVQVFPWGSTDANYTVHPSNMYGPVGMGVSGDGSELFVVSLDLLDDSQVYTFHVYDNPTWWDSTFTLSVSPSPALLTQTVHVEGTLERTDGTPIPDASVSVDRRDPLGNTTPLGSATTDAGGQFTVADKPSDLGTYTYTASFAGAGEDRSSTGTTSVQVTEATGQILYDSDIAGPYFQIFKMKDDGTARTQVTTGSYDNVVPVWSPDGSKIAFMSDRMGNFNIYVMNADGSGLTQLTSNSAFDGFPAWSPDGTHIAFESNRGHNYDIYTISATGGSLKRITTNPKVDELPSWSPGGGRLAFDTNRNGNYDIYTITTSGKDAVQKTTSPKQDYEARYSPDGTKLAFISTRAGGTHIFSDTLGTNTVKQLTTDPSQNELDPAWSTDGYGIAFSSSKADTWEIARMQGAGGSRTQLTFSPGTVINEFPNWFMSIPPSSSIVFPAGTEGRRVGSPRGRAGGEDWRRVLCGLPSALALTAPCEPS